MPKARREDGPSPAIHSLVRVCAMRRGGRRVASSDGRQIAFRAAREMEPAGMKGVFKVAKAFAGIEQPAWNILVYPAHSSAQLIFNCQGRLSLSL